MLCLSFTDCHLSSSRHSWYDLDHWYLLLSHFAVIHLDALFCAFSSALTIVVSGVGSIPHKKFLGGVEQGHYKLWLLQFCYIHVGSSRRFSVLLAFVFLIDMLRLTTKVSLHVRVVPRYLYALTCSKVLLLRTQLKHIGLRLLVKSIALHLLVFRLNCQSCVQRCRVCMSFCSTIQSDPLGCILHSHQRIALWLTLHLFQCHWYTE